MKQPLALPRALLLTAFAAAMLLLVPALGRAAVTSELEFAPDWSATSRTVVLDAWTSSFQRPGYRHAAVGLFVWNADNGTTVVAYQPDQRLTPASVTKAFTTAYALDRLGPDHTFATRAYLSSGTLAIVGSGDPTFGSSRVPGSDATSTLLTKWSASIQKATASAARPAALRVVLDQRFANDDPIPGPWQWEDIGNYYGAGAFTLNYNDNLFLVQFAPSASVGLPAPIARIEPTVPGVAFRNLIRYGPPGSGDKADIYGAPGISQFTLRGTVAAGPPLAIKGALPDPAAAFIHALTHQLQQDGVAAQPGTTETIELTAQEVASNMSPPLGEIVRITNKQSFNLYAEALLLAGGRAEPGIGAGGDIRASALKGRAEFLRSLGAEDGLILRDGSGLSTSNRITAASTARFFAAMGRHRHAALYKESLPWYGHDGDLRSRKDTAGRLNGLIHAKTGLITGARTLAGYLDLPSGKHLTFALLVNGYNTKWQTVDIDMDEVLSAIVSAVGE